MNTMRKRRASFVNAKARIKSLLEKESPRRMNTIRKELTMTKDPICSLPTMYEAIIELDDEGFLIKKSKPDNDNYVELYLAKKVIQDLSANATIVDKKKLRELNIIMAEYFGINPDKISVTEFNTLLEQ